MKTQNLVFLHTTPKYLLCILSCNRYQIVSLNSTCNFCYNNKYWKNNVNNNIISYRSCQCLNDSSVNVYINLKKFIKSYLFLRTKNIYSFPEQYSEQERGDTGLKNIRVLSPRDNTLSSRKHPKNLLSHFCAAMK